MNPLDAIHILTGWIRHLQVELHRAHRTIRDLEHDLLAARRQLAEQDTQMSYFREWMQGRTPAEIVELAGELAEVA